MRHIKKNNIPEELYHMPVMIYGGGYTGRVIAELLYSKKVEIKNIIDDDEGIQGTYIGNTEIISYEKFCECSKTYEETAVILTTIYGKPILKKLNALSKVQVYEIYDWYIDLIEGNGRLQRVFQDAGQILEVKKQIGLLKGKWADEETEQVLEGLMAYLDTRNLNDIAQICTEEEHYFIPEVKAAIKRPLDIIDGGAYRGELLQALKDNSLKFEKWHCFEADAKNYGYLLKQAERTGLDGKQICINKGLWSETGKLFFEGGKDVESRIVSYETDHMIDVVSIDDYLKNGKCSYIKMDIEGAELPALKGGIQTIKRERPILAISVYHSLEDFWKIPQYLMSELKEYRYYVRHHSLIFSETVLYGIPKEL